MIQIRPASATVAMILAANTAEAHAFLRTATPRVGSTVATAPNEVTIDFTESVEPTFSTIAVTDAAGARVDTGPAHLDGGDARLAVALKPIAPGLYRVTWRATATDTHRTEGSFTFTVTR